MEAIFEAARMRLANLVGGAQLGCTSTRDDLLLHIEGFKNRFIAKLGRRHQLSANDIEDAQQEGVFWVLEALQHYETRRPSGTSAASFATFLYRVLSYRFLDFLTRRRRVERRERSTSYLFEGNQRRETGGMYRVVARRGATESSDDPADLAEFGEASQRLQRALAQLDENSLQLWALLASGAPLRTAAAQLGVSYEAARRRRRRLLAAVKSSLEERPTSNGRTPK